MAMNKSLRSGAPTWVVPLLVVSLVLVFLGERVFATMTWLHVPLTALGAVLVLALAVVRWASAFATAAEQRTVERALAVLSTGTLLALVVYFATTDRLEHLIGVDAMALASRRRFESVATVAWITLLAASVVPMLFAERALFPMRRAAHVEWRRVREALAAGLVLSLATVYGALFTFTAGELGIKADFSYFHTARPSESTRKVAASTGDAIDVTAFFPELNPVGAEVATYLRDLSRDVPAVHVQILDRLLAPDVARQAKVFDDGVIVIERGGKRESIPVGVELTAARPKLKTLDADFQKALLKVARTRRTAYFTAGHGELNDAQPTPQNEGRTGKGIREILEQQDYGVRDLTATNGLGVEVPDDASIVFVVGPQAPFLPEEVGTLGRYAARGGRLFLCLDPEAKVNLQPLADLVGLRISSSALANDKVHLRRRFNDSDHGILVTNRYSSHASVSTLGRIASRSVVLVGAGSLDRKPGVDAAMRIDFAIRAPADTFNDENGNFLFDPPAESRSTYAVGAAVAETVAAAPSKKNDEMRAFVVADADAVSDAVLGNEANVLLIADAVRWLGGEESFAGAMATPEDVRIEHTKQKDLVWFYGTIFGAPALVLGCGLLYTRRIRRAKTGPGRRGSPESVPDRGVPA